jgi:group I intron endonuclease
MEFYGYIYRRTNTVNGKVYIGQCTQKGFDPRWAECICEAKKGKGGRLGSAIRKYGQGVFSPSRIYYAKSLKELNRMETFFIILHQSHLHENGYNLTLGGDSKMSPFKGKPSHNPEGGRIRKVRGYRHSALTRKHMSEARLGKPNLARRGKSTSIKGKTYEEIMGVEKAVKLRKLRSTEWHNNHLEDHSVIAKKGWETRRRNLEARKAA